MAQHDSQLGPVLGGFTNVKVNGAKTDVVIYRSGLLFADHSGDTVKDLRRKLDQTPEAELLRRFRFVGFGDVAHARIVKESLPIKVALDLGNGEELEIVERWTSVTFGKDDQTLLKDLLTELRNTGPMPEPAAAEAARVWAEDAVVLDATGNVKVNGIEYDLVILDVGFVFIADPGSFHLGKERLTKLVSTVPPPEIVGRNWLVRYEQVIDARIDKAVPVSAELELYDGLRLGMAETWTGQELTDDTREVLIAALCSVGAPRPDGF